MSEDIECVKKMDMDLYRYLWGSVFVDDEEYVYVEELLSKLEGHPEYEAMKDELWAFGKRFYHCNNRNDRWLYHCFHQVV